MMSVDDILVSAAGVIYQWGLFPILSVALVIGVAAYFVRGLIRSGRFDGDEPVTAADDERWEAYKAEFYTSPSVVVGRARVLKVEDVRPELPSGRVAGRRPGYGAFHQRIYSGPSAWRSRRYNPRVVRG